MCGIVGYVGEEQVAPILLDGLRRLEYRGYDSAGVAIHRDGDIALERAVGKLRNLEKALTIALSKARSVSVTRVGPHMVAPRNRTRIRTAPDR